ncbi:MAG: hypothetical protein GY838_01705 [bacterium]|nr:hypothetical protein [bacterium]
MKRCTMTMTVLILGLAAAVAPAQTGWILTSDYSTFGNVRACDGPDPWTVSGDLAAVPGDAVGRFHDGLVYVVGRGAHNLLQVWDPADGFSLVDEHSLGSNLNPQDVAFDTSGEAYVSCYDAAVILRVDPADGSILGSYSTASFADADGLPETSWIAALGDLLYISCQKLDRNNFYTPTGPGALLVFDMAAETWVDMDATTPGVQPITLAGANPYTRIHVTGGLLAVGCAGQFGAADGGIEIVDPATGLSLGFAVTEAQLGGDLNRIQPHGDAWLAVVNDAAFNTFVARTDAGTVTELDSGTGFVHGDILLAGDDLWVADRTTGAAGLRVLDAVTGAARPSGLLDTGLPPVVFIAGDPGDPAVTPVPALLALRLGVPTPNPFNPSTTLALAGRPAAAVCVTVSDLRGHLVRRATVTLDAAGQGRFRFDGRDGAGRLLAAGVYVVTARTGGATSARATTLLK